MNLRALFFHKEDSPMPTKGMTPGRLMRRAAAKARKTGPASKGSMSFKGRPTRAVAEHLRRRKRKGEVNGTVQTRNGVTTVKGTFQPDRGRSVNTIATEIAAGQGQPVVIKEKSKRPRVVTTRCRT